MLQKVKRINASKTEKDRNDNKNGKLKEIRKTQTSSV